jgi:hypothetical protein
MSRSARGGALVAGAPPCVTHLLSPLDWVDNRLRAQVHQAPARRAYPATQHAAGRCQADARDSVGCGAFHVLANQARRLRVGAGRVGRNCRSSGADRPVSPMMGTARVNGSSNTGGTHMAVEAGTWQEERVAGRVWTVRLDPYGRPSAGTVRLSCSRPACADQRFPGGATAGRKAAVGHVNTHLAHIRAGGGPRPGAWCACRAADCTWHTPDPTTARGGARPAAGSVRCGGPVVLTVYADRAGRLWRIAEMCARCAAATPDCRVLDTAPPPARTTLAGTDQAPGKPAAEREPAGGTDRDGVAAVFSDRVPFPAAGASSSPVDTPASVPRSRAVSPGGASRGGEAVGEDRAADRAARP